MITVKIYQQTTENKILSNSHQTGRWPIFNNADKAQLEAFIPQDSRTWKESWNVVWIEMNYAFSLNTFKRVMESIGYHQHMPQRNFAIRPADRPIRIAWC